MKTVGIICEYNPYHAGHARQLDAARRDTGADVVIAVMSEHTTQRGEFAVADGYARAEAAMHCGADIVIGLPFPYSSAPAEFFAAAGVHILNAMGIDALHFGSECGEIESLQQAARRLYSPDFLEQLTIYQVAHPERGIMDCRAAVYEQLYQSPLPGGSNNLLAMSYLHALDAMGSTIQPATVKRDGQAYNDADAPTKEQFPSATALRQLWQNEGLNALQPHLPAPMYDTLVSAATHGLAPISTDAIGTAILTYYRTADAEMLSQCADMEGGLAQRMIDAAKSAADLPSLLALVATKRYTSARIRRTLLFGLCGVRSEDLRRPPAYVRLLAANKTGCAYLSSIRKTCALPIVTKPADVPTNARALRQRAIEERLEALLTLAYPTPQAAPYLTKQHPFIEK